MKRLKVPILLASAILLGVGVFWLVATSRAATETPDYQVVHSDNKIEIRDYPELVVAMAPMEGAGMNGSFGKLFRFINSEKIEMTTPVLIGTSKGQTSMSFIMPKKTVENGVPTPTGEEVTLGKLKPGRFAVLRFVGQRSAENEKAAVNQLRTWLSARKLVGIGEPMLAYYDPPWTPQALRRNEVMIRIEKQGD